MKKSYLFYVNLVLAAILIALSGISFEGLGVAIGNFAIGLVLGLVLTGLFMFFYNIAKPGNTLKVGIPERVTAGLICAILLALITGGPK